MMETVNSKSRDNLFTESIDSIDILTDRVKSLLGKTISIHHNDPGTNNAETSETRIPVLSPPPPPSDLFGDDDDDDLTEYLPIAKRKPPVSAKKNMLDHDLEFVTTTGIAGKCGSYQTDVIRNHHRSNDRDLKSRTVERKKNCLLTEKVFQGGYRCPGNHSATKHCSPPKRCRCRQMNDITIQKQHILKVSVAMIKRIDKLLEAYQQQTSLLNNMTTDNGEISSSSKQPLSWFLKFNHSDDYYRIECVQHTPSLPELFEERCGEFKIRSLMRTLKIQDNKRWRVETAEQRKRDIIQVHMLGNDVSRPLPPVERRVFTHRQMRKQTEKIYRRLPEVKARTLRDRREEDANLHRMMANVFKQKLRENAVRGKLNWPITSKAISK